MVAYSKQKKLMKSMKFPKELDLKVDPSKVNWLVMTEWVAKRVTELLGVEDDVLIQTINNKLQEKKASNELNTIENCVDSVLHTFENYSFVLIMKSDV